MNATVKTATRTISINRTDREQPILIIKDAMKICLRAGTAIEINGNTFTYDGSLADFSTDLKPGCDYGMAIDDAGIPYIVSASATNPLDEGMIAGFHVAPLDRNGNAAISPNSLWDIDFRPACPDPRGMTRMTVSGKAVWVDIYLLGTEHATAGTSRCGSTIADGRDLPVKTLGEGRYRKLDYFAAVEIYAHHGKRLLTAEEFFAAAYGVTERCSRSDEPMKTGDTGDEASRFVSHTGLLDATGTMWQWGTDGHPDDPRPSFFGGSWVSGGGAGSRCASLACWPGSSVGSLSARGACDHLAPV
ncbi:MULTISPECIES: hypothetical protein [unclassified Rhizobium]